MPQWFRDPAASAAKYPDERAWAIAPEEQQPPLRRYDHHVVRIGGRPALVLTYHWDLEENAPAGGRRFEVSFTYPGGHPAAPPEVQAAVDSLTFLPVAPSGAD